VAQDDLAAYLIRVKEKIMGKQVNWDAERRPLKSWTGVTVSTPVDSDDSSQTSASETIVGLNLSNTKLECDMSEFGKVFGPHMKVIKLDKNPELHGLSGAFAGAAVE
jgi:hypothetical protein